jgi:predicted glycosyltransferase
MKPVALLYCQHSLGLGHFIRSLSLAEAMTQHFKVKFLNGGPLPEGIDLPASIDFVHLPPLRMAEDGSLFGRGEVDALLAARRDCMLAVARAHRPSVLVVELYPFGRKKFAPEIDPLIAAVRSGGGRVACSVRDVLVNARPDQQRHDDRAAERLNRQFDTVLVHSDARIFRLDESFRPAIPLLSPVHHTGFVTRANMHCSLKPEGPTLVTGGGGIVGHALYFAAIDAQTRLFETRGWRMELVAGPLFPADDWVALQDRAKAVPGLALHRAVSGMAGQLAACGRVVSQCGYNSALEIVQSGRPALFVPFARGQESEQTMRAEQFKHLGLADWMAEAAINGETLADRLLALRLPAGRTRLALDGAETSAMLLQELVA